MASAVEENIDYTQEVFARGADLTKDSPNAAKHRARAQVYHIDTLKEREQKSAELEPERKKAWDEYNANRGNHPHYAYPKCDTCGLIYENTAPMAMLQSFKTSKWETICLICQHIYLYPQIMIAEDRRDRFLIRRNNDEFESVRKYRKLGNN